MIRRFPMLILLPLLLAACESGSVRDTLGLNRDAPDEFRVVSRPPLSVPPEFNLRPPRPGAPSPLTPDADETARGVILGKPAKTTPGMDTLTEPSAATAVTPVLANDAPTPAGSALLKRAGADTADTSIRDQLGQDARTPVDTSKAKTLYEKLVGDDKAEPVVDAKKEAERLRGNKDEGKAVTEGTVPEVETGPKSVIDRIF